MENKKTEASKWFQQAASDLEAVRWNIEGKFYDTGAFLAQQTAEKAVKALLFYLGAKKKALLSHSIFEMMNEAGKHDPKFPLLLEEARELDLHYVPSRYPNGLPSGFPHMFYEKKMAVKALASAEKIFFAVSEYFEAHGETEILASS